MQKRRRKDRKRHQAEVEATFQAFIEQTLAFRSEPDPVVEQLKQAVEILDAVRKGELPEVVGSIHAPIPEGQARRPRRSLSHRRHGQRGPKTPS